MIIQKIRTFYEASVYFDKILIKNRSEMSTYMYVNSPVYDDTGKEAQNWCKVLL